MDSWLSNCLKSKIPKFYLKEPNENWAFFIPYTGLWTRVIVLKKCYRVFTVFLMATRSVSNFSRLAISSMLAPSLFAFAGSK